MLLLETFKVRIFLKIENRWLAYVQMRYQLESTKTIHRRWDHLLFGRWLVTLRGQSSAEHGDRSIIFHGRGTIRLANLVKKLRLGYVIMVQYAANQLFQSEVGCQTFNVLAAFREIFHSHCVVDSVYRCIVSRIYPSTLQSSRIGIEAVFVCTRRKSEESEVNFRAPVRIIIAGPR